MFGQLPSLRALRAFEATARLGSFTAAADELHVTQGAVSRQVQELERVLGVAVVHRSGPRIALTEAGKQFAHTSQAVLGELQQGVDAVIARARKGHVTLTMLPSVATKWLAPRLGRFIQEHPDIELRVSATRRVLTIDGNEIDAAIRYGRGDWQGVDCELLASETVFPVCAPGYVKSAGLKNPRNLLDATLLPAEIKEDWSAWLDAAGVTSDAIASGPALGDYAAILQAAADGHGVALGRSVLVADDLKSGRLVRPFDFELKASGGYWFTTPNHVQASESLALVKAWFVDEFQSASK